MAAADAYLFYGLFVTLPSLLIAANAHGSPSLLALNLISLRARRGSLTTVGEGGAVSRIPLELWLLIRAELEDIVWIEAENELIRSMYHSEKEYARDLERLGPALKWSEVFGQYHYETSWEDELHFLLTFSFDTLSEEDSKVSLGTI